MTLSGPMGDTSIDRAGGCGSCRAAFDNWRLSALAAAPWFVVDLHHSLPSEMET